MSDTRKRRAQAVIGLGMNLDPAVLDLEPLHCSYLCPDQVHLGGGGSVLLMLKYGRPLEDVSYFIQKLSFSFPGLCLAHKVYRSPEANQLQYRRRTALNDPTTMTWTLTQAFADCKQTARLFMASMIQKACPFSGSLCGGRV